MAMSIPLTYKIKSIILLSSDFAADFSRWSWMISNYCMIGWQLTLDKRWITFRLCTIGRWLPHKTVFTRRQGKVQSLMKSLSSTKLWLNRHSTCFIITNKYLEQGSQPLSDHVPLQHFDRW